MLNEGTLQFVALKCRQCGSPLDAETGDVFLYCTHCSTGFELVGDDLLQTGVVFAALTHPPNGRIEYRPFWRIHTKTTIRARRAMQDTEHSGKALGWLAEATTASTGVGTRGSKPKESTDGLQPGTYDVTYYVPAFVTSIRAVRRIGTGFTKKQPAIGDLIGEKLLGARFTRTDAIAMCGYILVSIEADRPDKMRALDYSIETVSAEVIGIPCVNEGKGWRDAFLGIPLSADGD